MDKAILECVPNVSEGRNPKIIHALSYAISSINGVKLLHTDSSYDANRTVFTFAGKPNAVLNAAYNLVLKASEIIDMSLHSGEHPRFGAVDVCPLIPIKGISMEETIILSEKLAEKIARNLNIPIYLYNKSAKYEERKHLANCRKGEYEGLEKKLKQKEWKPDYGPSTFNTAKKTGAIALGARNFLIAFNVNLNTDNVKLAEQIASTVRASGKLIKDKNNNLIRTKGLLEHVKAIGWFMNEYKCAQVSMNLTDFRRMPLHIVYEEIKQQAKLLNLKVTGSELIGLIPIECLLNAAKFYTKNKSIHLTNDEKIEIAIKSIGLGKVRPFNKKNKVLEYLINL